MPLILKSLGTHPTPIFSKSSDNSEITSIFLNIMYITPMNIPQRSIPSEEMPAKIYLNRQCRIHVLTSIPSITGAQTVCIPQTASFGLGFLSKALWCSCYDAGKMIAMRMVRLCEGSRDRLSCESNQILRPVEMWTAAQLFTVCLCFNFWGSTINKCMCFTDINTTIP